MYQSKEELMMEEALGDAALDLLKKNRPVSRQSIEDTLKRMLSQETDVAKKRACRDAIREIQLSREAQRQQPALRIKEQRLTRIRHVAIMNAKPPEEKH